MIDKHDLESFVSDIDKIISGELTIPSGGEHYDQEYEELLTLAQLLAKADYSAEDPERMKRIWSNLHHKGQMDDDELDMVAGGVNPNVIFDNEDKKSKF